MRQLLITLLFFFWPVLLMFVLRYAALLLRLWLAWRRSRPDVIDVTPEVPARPSPWFVALAVGVGLVTAALAWHRLNEPPAGDRVYVPAHLDDQGRLVPGHFRGKEEATRR